MATFTNNDYTRINGNLKTVYAKMNMNVVPPAAKFFFEDFKFDKANLEGDSYTVGVNLQVENGITFAGGVAGGVTLTAPVAGAIKQAKVDGYQVINNAYISWDMAIKAKGAPDAAAFTNLFKPVISNLQLGANRAISIAGIHAGSTTGIGKVASVAGAVITLDQANTAPGVFIGSDNMLVDVWDPTFATKRAGPTQLLSYDMSSVAAPKITVDSGTGVVAGDIVVPTGWYSGVSTLQIGLGISGILGTRNSTLFNISQTSFPMFQPNVYDAASQSMSQSIFDAASLLAYNNGYYGDSKCYLHPDAWKALNIELTSRVKPDAYSTDAKAGYSGIKYQTLGGVVEVVASPYIKRGEGFIIPQDGSFRRVGAAEFKLGDPLDEDLIIRRVEGKALYSIVGYTFQGPFTDAPWFATKIINIG